MVTVNNSCQTTVSNIFFKRFFNFSSTSMIYKYLFTTIQTSDKDLNIITQFEDIDEFRVSITRNYMLIEIGTVVLEKGIVIRPHCIFRIS